VCSPIASLKPALLPTTSQRTSSISCCCVLTVGSCVLLYLTVC
jgi:hypothetical protein